MTRWISLPALGAPVDTTKLLAGNAGSNTVTAAQLRDYITDGQPVSAKRYGAKGDGVTDDTAAIQAALATGKNVSLGLGIFRTTAPLVLSTWGQALLGTGRGKAAGSSATRGGTQILSDHTGDTFQIGSMSGAMIWGVTIGNFWIIGQRNQTGYCFNVANTTLVTIRDVMTQDTGGLLYARKANYTVMERVNASGSLAVPAWVFWDGRNDRSDVLTLSDCNIGDTVSDTRVPEANRPCGILWDGNANTLRIRNSSIVGASRGLWTQNTNAQPTPCMGLFAYDFEVDHHAFEGLRFEAGRDFYLTDYYGNAGGYNTTDAIYIGQGVSNVSIKTGQVYAWQQRAVYCDGTDVEIVGTWMGGGSQAGANAFPAVYFDTHANRCHILGGGAGQYNGSVGNNSYGVQTHAGAQNISVLGCSLAGGLGRYLDGSNNLQVLSGFGSTNAAVLDFGNNTNMEFDKSSQRWLIRTANAARLGMYGDRIESFLPHRVPPMNKANLPAPTANLRGSMVYVLDATGGEIPAFCDGTAWRRLDDRTVVA